jgi:putative transposase
MAEKRSLVQWDHPKLSVRRQCELLGLNRSTLYYPLGSESDENLALMRQLDEQYLKTPCYGSRKMAKLLGVNRKRAQRLMRKMGLEAVYPKPKTSRAAPGHKIFPYLLRGLKIQRPNQVWSADVTYLPLRQGFMYLVAVLDWYSRYVVAWRLSNTLETHFCVAALEEALRVGTPEIFNTDQGAQFTAAAFVKRVQASGAKVSMDGRGRALDNVFVERLWRTVKYEDVYLRDYETAKSLQAGLLRYFTFYNDERLHQSLDYQVPSAVHFE